MHAPRLLDRIAAVLSKVRPGEGLPIVLLLVDLFPILTAYDLLEVVREPLILLGGGAEATSDAAAGQAVLLVPARGRDRATEAPAARAGGRGDRYGHAPA